MARHFSQMGLVLVCKTKDPEFKSSLCKRFIAILIGDVVDVIYGRCTIVVILNAAIVLVLIILKIKINCVIGHE